MSEQEMIPKYRFDEANDKRKEAEARIKDLEEQLKGMAPATELAELRKQVKEFETAAKTAEKLASDLEAKKAEIKKLTEDHVAANKARDRHDALRDLVTDFPSLADAEVRNLFLSKMPEGAEDPAEFVRGLTAEDAEVPTLLKAFLPDPAATATATDQGGRDQAKPRDTVSKGKPPRGNPAPFTNEQIESMTTEEYAANRAAIYRQHGLPVPPTPSTRQAGGDGA